jgi:hypothetical protein
VSYFRLSVLVTVSALIVGCAVGRPSSGQVELHLFHLPKEEALPDEDGRYPPPFDVEPNSSQADLILAVTNGMGDAGLEFSLVIVVGGERHKVWSEARIDNGVDMSGASSRDELRAGMDEATRQCLLRLPAGTSTLVLNVTGYPERTQSLRLRGGTRTTRVIVVSPLGIIFPPGWDW